MVEWIGTVKRLRGGVRCPFPLPPGKALGWSEPGVSWALGEGEERMGVSKGPFPGAPRSAFTSQSLFPS